jgi:hypothetical protein
MARMALGFHRGSIGRVATAEQQRVAKQSDKLLATTMKRVTEVGAGGHYALRNASRQGSGLMGTEEDLGPWISSPPLTLASPVIHQRCFRPSHVFALASFLRRQRADVLIYRSRAFFASGVGLESGKGGLETPAMDFSGRIPCCC